MSFLIKAPMINPNEDEARLVEWLKHPGDHVHKGEMLCILETMKSTFELDAPESGFLNQIAQTGDAVNIGQIIAVLTEEKDQPYELPTSHEKAEITQTADKQWTKKAQIIAKRNGLDIAALASQIQPDGLLTETDILAYLQKKQPKQNLKSPQSSSRKNVIERVLIIGGGNVASLVLDILSRVPSQQAIGIVDDNPALMNKTIIGCPVLGNLSIITQLWKNKAFDAAALAVGNLPARATLFEKFTQAGIPFTNIIDPTAVIGAECEMGTGNMIMAFCRLGPESTIGANNFLSAYVNIEHHNTMGSHCTFGPNVFMSGGVNIGDQVKFGTGISIEPRLTIGSHVTIASGTILTTHVPDNTVVKTKSNFNF